MDQVITAQIRALLLQARRRSPINRIASQTLTLKGKVRVVAQYLLQNLDSLEDLTVEQIVSSCSTSRATVMRACNELGYQNFTQLKDDLLRATSITHHEELDTGADPAYATMERCLTMLLDTFSTFDGDRIAEAATLLLRRSPIIIYGGAMSGGIARVVHSRFRRMGLHVYGSSDTEQMYHELRRGTGVLFCISHVAGSANVFSVLSQAQQNKVPAILLTNMETAPAVRYADIVLTTNITSHLTHGYDILARTTQLFVIEMLCQAIEGNMSQV